LNSSDLTYAWRACLVRLKLRPFRTPDSLSRDPDDEPPAVAAFGGRCAASAVPTPRRAEPRTPSSWA